MADIIVAAVVVLAVFLAGYGYFQGRKRGGSCSGCPSFGACSGCCQGKRKALGKRGEKSGKT